MTVVLEVFFFLRAHLAFVFESIRKEGKPIKWKRQTFSFFFSVGAHHRRRVSGSRMIPRPLQTVDPLSGPSVGYSTWRNKGKSSRSNRETRKKKGASRNNGGLSWTSWIEAIPSVAVSWPVSCQHPPMRVCLGGSSFISPPAAPPPTLTPSLPPRS